MMKHNSTTFICVVRWHVTAVARRSRGSGKCSVSTCKKEVGGGGYFDAFFAQSAPSECKCQISCQYIHIICFRNH